MGTLLYEPKPSPRAPGEARGPRIMSNTIVFPPFTPTSSPIGSLKGPPTRKPYMLAAAVPQMLRIQAHRRFPTKTLEPSRSDALLREHKLPQLASAISAELKGPERFSSFRLEIADLGLKSAPDRTKQSPKCLGRRPQSGTTRFRSISDRSLCVSATIQNF